MKKHLSLIVYGIITVLFIAFGINGCANYPNQKQQALEQAVKEKGYENITEERMTELKGQVKLSSKVEGQITGNAVADWFVPLSYVLVAVAILGSIILPLIYAFTQDPKSLLGIALSVGVLFVLFFICYIFADGSAIKTNTVEMGGEGSKYIGGVLIMTYIMIAFAFGGAILGELTRSFK